jgi:hypothetical protein
MKTTAAAIAMALVAAMHAGAQQSGQADKADKAIRARLHGTFVDRANGLGVLSGDTTFTGFDVQFGTLRAIGRMEGALADSKGEPLGHVDQEVALTVSQLSSTCNQLRLELDTTTVDVLQTSVRLDKEVAGFDSRQGAMPKQEPALCAVAQALDADASLETRAALLNDVVAAIAAR